MPSSRNLLCAVLVVTAAVMLLSGAGVASAQLNNAKPKELEGVGVTEHPDAQVPLDLEFQTAEGDSITLGDLMDAGRPVILTLNYSDCPRLCVVQLNGLVDSVSKMPWNLGQEYDVITVSIDPAELPERAKLTKQKYLEAYGRPGGGSGWHFLVGSEENIKKLAETVGFGYTFYADQYIHVAVLMILTPDGRISRYIYGVEYDPQTLKLSLVEAAEGKVGSPMDQILLYCFHYDSSSGRYGLAAFNLIRAGGAVTLAFLVAVLSLFWVREKRKTKKDSTADSPQQPLEEGS